MARTKAKGQAPRPTASASVPELLLMSEALSFDDGLQAFRADWMPTAPPDISAVPCADPVADVVPLVSVTAAAEQADGPQVTSTAGGDIPTELQEEARTTDASTTDTGATAAALTTATTADDGTTKSADPLTVEGLAARYMAARRSLVAFRQYLLPSPGDCAAAPYMARWSQIILNGKQNFAVEAFRESAKSQIALRANLLHALTFPDDKRSFIVIIRATRDLAAALLRETSREWQARPDLMMQSDGTTPDIVEDSGNALQVKYHNGQQVRIAAFGKGGSIRGLSWGAKRPDLIVCDDIQDLEDVSSESVVAKDWAWFMSDIYFLGHESRIFLIGNNLGERCIIERLLRESDAWGFQCERLPKMVSDGQGGYVSSWPARYSVADILEQKEAFAQKGMADIWYREMLCEARSPDAQRFRREMFRYYDPRTIRREELSVYMTVDLASSKAASADYSVCCVVGVDRSGMWQVLDLFYGRVTPSEHMDEIFKLVQKWRPISVGIEKVQYQAAMLDFLQKEMPRRNVFFNITPLIAAGHKEQRIDMIQPRFSVGSVWFPAGAAWLQEMEGELLAFPTGSHDDLIDALAYMEQVASPPVMGYSNTAIDDLPGLGEL